MSLPYFPMYPTDFEADTAHLTLEEDGAYNRLLRLMWMTPGCSLPDDNAWIARRMRVDAVTMARVILPIIAEFLERKGGRILSARLMREWKKVDETSRLRSEAGKKGGRPKATENKQEQQKPGFDFDKARPKQPEPEPDKKELGKPNSIGFSEFWPIWPNKTAKASAEKAWRNLSQPDRAAAIENAVPWFNGWRIRNPHASPIHPATYLNQKRWTDETQTSLTLIPGARHEQPTRSASTLAAFIGGAAGAS